MRSRSGCCRPAWPDESESSAILISRPIATPSRSSISSTIEGMRDATISRPRSSIDRETSSSSRVVHGSTSLPLNLRGFVPWVNLSRSSARAISSDVPLLSMASSPSSARSRRRRRVVLASSRTTTIVRAGASPAGRSRRSRCRSRSLSYRPMVESRWTIRSSSHCMVLRRAAFPPLPSPSSGNQFSTFSSTVGQSIRRSCICSRSP